MTRPIPASEVDTRVLELLRDGDIAQATALLLEAYGPDVFGFLIGVLEDMRSARAAYGAVVKRMTAELPAFQGKCSPRVWLYSLAHRELDERRGRATRTETRQVAATKVWRHAALVTVIGAVRRALTEEERELLILRVDRLLDWHSLAITQLGEAAALPLVVYEARVLRGRIEALIERIESLTALHLRLQ